MHVEGTHKYSYEYFRRIYLFSDYIFYPGGQSVLDHDNFLPGLDFFYIYDRAVSWTHHVFAGRNRSDRISEKPDISPKQNRGEKQECRSQQHNPEFSCFHATRSA